MNKFLAIFLTLAMLLCLIPAMAVTTHAADVPGDWTTYRAASEYPEGDDVRPQKPEAGYKYIEEGFTVIPADYTDSTPFMTVQTKEPQPVQDGIYLDFRVDDYSYNGPEHNIDSWICISITNKPKVVPGATTYGGGWMCLIRGNGAGAEAKAESWNTVEASGSYGGAFQNLGTSTVTPKMDNAGHELYTFEATYNGSQYNFKLNGVPLNGMSTASSNLKNLDPNGEFYVGITLYSSVKDGTAALTILNYGTDKSHAYPPTGTDSKEPEPNLIKVAEIEDPSTVPENQPALYWDASVVDAPNGTNVKLDPLGDNSFRVTMSETYGFFSWNMSRTVSYSGTDFPIFTVLLRNYYGEGGTLWYYGGNILGATDTNHEDWSVSEGLYYDHEDDEYIFVTVDLSELWEGRINGMRFDFSTLENYNEFDICYMGFFRSEEEALNYTETRLAEWGVDVGAQETETETSAEETEPQDTADVTEAPTEADTKTEESQNTAVTDDPTTEQGCASFMGTTAAGLLVLAVAAGAVMRKKKES